MANGSEVVLTFSKARDHVAVHGQTEGVARLSRELLRILRPLPAVPVRAEKELDPEGKGMDNGWCGVVRFQVLHQASVSTASTESSGEQKERA